MVDAAASLRAVSDLGDGTAVNRGTPTAVMGVGDAVDVAAGHARRAKWHPETRPINLNLITDQSKWLGLTVKRSEQTAPDQAIVEFIARYKVNGKAQRLHEISRFKRIDKQWYYLDGDIL